MDPTKLGAREAAALIAEGKLTAVGLTEACLARIEARDGANHDPKPFVRTADPNRILAAVDRGRKVLDSIH